ncbi:MAG: sulfotransferase [Bacteroidota bacterium]
MKPFPISQLDLPKSRIVGNSILIGGCMRSGTTIVGKLMGSLKEVNYFFEPAFMHRFLFTRSEMPSAIWKQLFEAYTFDDLYLNNLAGRNFNFNSHDGSYVHQLKSEAEISSRMERSYGRLELVEMAETGYFSFKLPDIVFGIKDLKKWYPDMKFLSMFRNANDVLNSILKKKWNTDSQLHVASPEPLRDYRLVGEMRVPKWVKEEDIQDWLGMSELDRTAYYYCEINEELLRQMDHTIVLDYDYFVKHPAQTLERLCSQWNLNKGDKTEGIVKNIYLRSAQREDLLTNVRPDLLDRIQFIQQAIGNYAGPNLIKAL